MSDRTVPERINEFLVRCAGRAYCDHCIQERLGLRWRQQVQLVTATLGVTSGYRRNNAACCTCGETKQVTAFVASTKATLSLPSQSKGWSTSNKRSAAAKGASEPAEMASQRS
ncbi:MAG: hypothetical protein JO110_21190 [Acetobacteraceae bacterium]|nr:hypothetical protein [Acetobacteraceae bacterium]